MCTFQNNDGGRRAAGYKGSAGDCVCRAISIVAQRPYKEVYAVLAEGNKKQRRSKWKRKNEVGVKSAARGINTKRKWFEDYMRSLGFAWVPTMKIGQGCKVHLRADELPSGRLIVNVSRHFTAVIDGVIHDTFDCSRGGIRCVYGYYYIFNERQPIDGQFVN